MNSDSRTILCIVAHPDDAEIAAGGTLASYVRRGCRVVILCITTSEAGSKLAERRRQAAGRAAAQLGAEVCWVKNGKLNQVEEVSLFETVKELDGHIASIHPDVIITHSAVDSHHDHRMVYEAVMSASRRTSASIMCMQPAEHRTPKFLQFIPNVFVDISGLVELKKSALSEYSYEGQGFRPVQIEKILTANRFYGGLVGCDYAEPFLLVRHTGVI